jgi:hypothetical protein
MVKIRNRAQFSCIRAYARNKWRFGVDAWHCGKARANEAFRPIRK